MVESATSGPEQPAPSDRRGQLRRIPLLRELDETGLGLVAEKLSQRQLQPAEVLFAEGDPGDALFVILEGGVRVVAGPDPAGTILARLWSSTASDAAISHPTE